MQQILMRKTETKNNMMRELQKTYKRNSLKSSKKEYFKDWIFEILITKEKKNQLYTVLVGKAKLGKQGSKFPKEYTNTNIQKKTGAEAPV